MFTILLSTYYIDFIIQITNLYEKASKAFPVSYFGMKMNIDTESLFQDVTESVAFEAVIQICCIIGLKGG